MAARFSRKNLCVGNQQKETKNWGPKVSFDKREVAMSMKAKDCFINKVLNKFSGQITNREVIDSLADDITDRVFLVIEEDKELKKEYDDLVNSGTNKHGLNSILGRRFRPSLTLRTKADAITLRVP